MMHLFQAVARLVRWGRIPFPLLALGVCLVFAAIGVAVVDDYGVVDDGVWQRDIAIANADYIMGDGDALPEDHNRFYGLAFEMPLLMAERVLGLQDGRDIYLMRHLLTHWFFIAGGFFCGLLVYRMFGSQWVALLAMLLFLLHPRLYAHSFFNSKDVPFAIMFVIALYLMHRAFRKDTVGAFALLGLVVGLAVNVRPFALLLPAAVLAMRGLDWRFASGWRRKRVLVTGGVFVGAVLLAVYVSQPYYWANPLRYVDGLQTLSQHPHLATNLFMGEMILSDAVPPGFVPVWFGITAPPLALLLGGLGVLSVCWRGLRSPGLMLRSGELRFLLAALGCLVLPVAVAIVIDANIYDGWRQMYFLWGPFCVLAAAGLRWRAGGVGGELPVVRLLRWVRGAAVRGKGRARRVASGGRGNLRRIVVYGVAVAGLANVIYAMVSLHPHQQVYFNLLVNRAVADELGERYGMWFVVAAYRQAIEYLLEQYPGDTLYLRLPEHYWDIFPAAERERIERAAGAADFYVADNMVRMLRRAPDGPVVHEMRAYGSTYVTVAAPRLVWGAGLRPGEEVYRAAHQRVTGEGGPAAQSDFDVYIRDGALYYVKDDCGPGDTGQGFFLFVFPENAASLPVYRREIGYAKRDFSFDWRGGYFDGKCITQEPLPDYAVRRVHTGQWLAAEGRELWRAEINLSPRPRLGELEARLAGLERAADGFFELYLDGGRLVYYREFCDAGDTRARFFLHIFPADEDDLPEGRREYGFDNRDFDFSEYGAQGGGKCLAEVGLPGYEIGRIRTGQYDEGGVKIWGAELPGGG